MAEYKRLGIVDLGDKPTIDLASSEFRRLEIIFDKDRRGRLELGALDFYLLFLSMLQEVNGIDLAYHMPSHGFGNHELNLDMLEAIIENITRIQEELCERISSDNNFSEVLRRRMMAKRGLQSGEDTQGV